jgi:hypothetical protein
VKLYIYEYVGGISSSYHDGGGLVIITDRDPADVWREHVGPAKSSSSSYDLDPETLVGKTPDLVLDIGDQSPERIFIFPDAGCC